jgi:hypothetical protein
MKLLAFGAGFIRKFSNSIRKSSEVFSLLPWDVVDIFKYWKATLVNISNNMAEAGEPQDVAGKI